jgi:uncharacterized phage protein (TIGR01671 family)
MIPKFRAWHKTWKEMGKVKRIRFDDDGNATTVLFMGKSLGENAKIDNLELMQSTGLKDKNGKEIFEGDIIRTSAYGCIVDFGEYTYFEDEHTQTTEIGFYLSFLNVTPATYAPFDKYYWDNCEVIGNIYENELDLIMYVAYKYNKETSEVE